MIVDSFDEKIFATLGDLTINKATTRELNIREVRAIPSFVEEWLVSRYQHPKKSVKEVYNDITEFMSNHLPLKTEKEQIKHRLQNKETVVLLDRFTVRVDISNNKKYVSVPSLDEHRALIHDDVIQDNEDLLLGGQWGAGRLRVRPEGNKYIIELIEFRPMQSGRVKLEQMIQARKEFSTEEWLSLLLRTMGYEPSAYNAEQKSTVILRLLPLVQNNLNMMELAPKGTGKSFIFSNFSRYAWLNSGGALTQAQLFKNMSTKELGLLARHDLLILDEGQSINFKGADDIHAKFKDYLESGHYSIGQDKIVSECGLMILANIDIKKNGKPRRSDYIKHLPELFHDDALLDRFHGIIPGWIIPRFSTTAAAKGLGIKADVFGEYAHQIRTANKYEFKYGEAPHLSGDSRDVKAVQRLASALSKLLLISIDDSEYEERVLTPAIELRGRVRKQLSELNPDEFKPTVDIQR